MKKSAIVFTLLLLHLIAKTQHNDEQAVRDVMNKQAEAWNKGHIDAFMETYWKNDSLLFVGSNGPVYGWQTTLEGYKKRYPDTAAMGKLDFNILQLKPLSSEFYFVLGKWHLRRTSGDIGGYFTLLFKKINSKWVIIADHTS